MTLDLARLDALFETASLDGANGTYSQQVNDFGDISYVGNISIGTFAPSMRCFDEPHSSAQRSYKSWHLQVTRRKTSRWTSTRVPLTFSCPTPTVDTSGTVVVNATRRTSRLVTNPDGNNRTSNVIADRCQEEFQCPADICSGKPYALPPESCAGLRGFDGAKSSTYKKDGKAWLIDYGIGSASGFTAVETVRVSANNLDAQ